MVRNQKSLANTNKYLRSHPDIEMYLASCTASSTLVEGVKIKDPFAKLEDSEFGKKIKFESRKNISLWVQSGR